MLLILMAIMLSLTVAADTKIYTYKTVGDINIEALVYLPSSDSSPSKYPVILGIHGGGYMSGKFDPFTNQEIEGITSRGWCIVSINYRLSPGVVLQDIIEDMSDAYNWIRNDLSKMVPINPDTIVVWGGSAGGGLALIAGYKLTPRPQAIVAFYPYFANFTDPSVYDSTEPVSDTLINLANSVRQPILTEYMPDDDPNRLRYKAFAQAIAEKKAGWFLTTMNPDESPENVTAMLKDYSVVYNIDENYPPTYLIHGMLDDVTPYTQSVQAADQLSKYNVSSKLVLLPNIGHGTEFLIAEQWNQNMEPLLAFVEEEVGYRPPTTIKRHIVLIIVLVVVSIVIIISSICLYKKLKLRQKKKSAQLVQSARPDSPSTSVGAKHSPSNTATPETLSPKEVKDDQVIIEIIPKKMSIQSVSVSGETNEHSREHTP